MPTLASSRSYYQPPCFEQSALGELFITNGLDDPLRVKGMAATATVAGIEAPGTNLAAAGSGVGSLTGAYTAYYRYVDVDGIPSSLSPISSSFTLTSHAQVDYTSVDNSSNSRVTKKQIFRNTPGQTTTYYLDVEINDNTTTTATGTKTDAQLVASTALPIVNADGTVNANRFEPPPDHKAVVVQHGDRFWYAVDVSYQQGNIVMTNSSTTVTGYGTAWTSNMAGRYLYIPQVDLNYLIVSVNTGAQTLVIASAWASATTRYGYYSIEPERDERNKIYFSFVGEPESVPADNNFKIQEIGGDELTGLMPLGQFLFATMRRHIYRISYAISPSDDLAVQKTVSRGCLNQRCWVRVEDVAYILDREGIYRYGGGYQAGTTENISEPIQDLFRENRINWEASRWFFASHNPTEEVVRFHVCLGDTYLPTHALCFHYRHQTWWQEDYPWMFGGSCIALMKNTSRCLLGGEFNTHYVQGEGLLDGPIYTSGTVTTRGTATSATFLTLSDTSAVFPENVEGSMVSIVAGRGKGQSRRIASVSGTTMTVKNPWIVKPDSTSEYQIGGIPFQARTGLLEFATEDSGGEIDYCTDRKIRLHVQPTTNEVTMDLRLYRDHEDEPRTDWITSDDYSGVTYSDGEADVVLDLIRTPEAPRQGTFSGYHHIDISAPRGDARYDENWMAVEVAGYQNKDRIVLYALRVDGVQ